MNTCVESTLNGNFSPTFAYSEVGLMMNSWASNDVVHIAVQVVANKTYLPINAFTRLILTSKSRSQKKCIVTPVQMGHARPMVIAELDKFGDVFSTG
jgi:hypothetical protein